MASAALPSLPSKMPSAARSAAHCGTSAANVQWPHWELDLGYLAARQLVKRHSACLALWSARRSLLHAAVRQLRPRERDKLGHDDKVAAHRRFRKVSGNSATRRGISERGRER
jgi:hypothetical protein